MALARPQSSHASSAVLFVTDGDDFLPKYAVTRKGLAASAYLRLREN